jgi:hypothetical protein
LGSMEIVFDTEPCNRATQVEVVDNRRIQSWTLPFGAPSPVAWL